MSAKKPLVFNSDGTVEELATTDTLDAVVSEVEVVACKNANAGSITKGQPVYVKTAGTTDVDLARANAKSTARPTIGLVNSTSIATTATGNIQTSGVLNVADWTDATGGATLTKGSEYFLSAATAGLLTTTAPTGTAGAAIVRVGTALDTTHMLIDIEFRGMVAA